MEPEENGVRNQTEERLKEEQITTKRNKREMIFLFLPTFFGKEEAKKYLLCCWVSLCTSPKGAYNYDVHLLEAEEKEHRETQQPTVP